jgi:hypothetical protein
MEKEYAFKWEGKNTKDIVMTVAMPIKDMGEISWLALESLRRQENINFGWELIIFEDGNDSKKNLDQFVGKLPGCERIIYNAQDLAIDGRKSGIFKGSITLIDKWIGISQAADKNSRVYVLQAGDAYSPNKMLSIHNENFKDRHCFYSTYPRGLFYHVGLKEKMFYDGYRSDINQDKRSFLTSTHLYTAIRTEDMLNIKPAEINRKIDKYIRVSVCQNRKIDLTKAKYVFSADDVNSADWMTGFNTDGLNTISYRKQIYKDPPAFSRLWLKYSNDEKKELGYIKEFENRIPKNVLDFLNSIKKTKKNR